MAPVVAVMWAIAWWASPGLGPDTEPRFSSVGGAIGLAIGCVLSPYGVGLTIERSRMVAEVCQGVITEWMSLIGAVKGGELRWIPVAIVARDGRTRSAECGSLACCDAAVGSTRGFDS